MIAPGCRAEPVPNSARGTSSLRRGTRSFRPVEGRAGRRIAGYFPLARRHADGAIESDGLTVQHGVLHDVEGRHGEFVGQTETGGMWHASRKRSTYFLGQPCQQGSVENAGCDRADSDLALCQIARRNDGHADDAGLGGRISDLTDLAFVGGDRCSEYANATFAVDRFILCHAGGCEAQAIEGADQIDPHDGLEFLERSWFAVLFDQPNRAADTSAVDQDA